MPTEARPEGWTDRHEIIAQALYADTWTEPKDDDPHPDWHHRFQWWQCARAAMLIVPALHLYDGNEESRLPVSAQSLEGGRCGQAALGERLPIALPAQDDRSEGSAVEGQTDLQQFDGTVDG